MVLLVWMCEVGRKRQRRTLKSKALLVNSTRSSVKFPKVALGTQMWPLNSPKSWFAVIPCR